MNSFSKLRCLARNFFGWWTLQVTLAVLVGVLVWLFGLFVAVVFWEDAAKHVSQGLGIPEKEGSKNEALKFLGIGMGGLLIAIQAVIANRRAKAMEKTANAQARATEEQAKANLHTEQGQRQERLKNAIEHLGHDKDSVRLGGAYELFHLARDTKDLRQTVLDILCAHIRRMTDEEGNYRAKHWSKPSEEVQSLLNLLFVQNHDVFGDFHVDLQGTWLKGANLQGARLEKADLTEAYLCGVALVGANLREANMTKVHLQEADLTKAQMQKAILKRARMQGACLNRVRLHEAQLYGAQMQGAKLIAARMQGAFLLHAEMQAADLYGAKLQLAILTDVKLQAARLVGARLQGATLDGVYLGGVSFGGFSSPKVRIRDRIGMPASLVGIILQGGLTEGDVASILEMVSDEEPSVLKARLESHIDEPVSAELPEDSEVTTEPYTAEEAEQWIAEYEEAMSEVPKEGS